MGKDYYNILGVAKGADDAEIKKAYRKLAMKWRPDKNPDNRATAEAKFNDVAEAYEILSDPETRYVYDTYLRKGLEAGGEPRSPAGASTYQYRSADDIFKEFFGGGGLGGGGFFDEIFGGKEESGAGPMGGMHEAPIKDEPITRQLGCTLEELFHGSTRMMKITRMIFDARGRATRSEEEVLKFDVKPGWKKGTKVTFQQKGNDRPGHIPADVVFILDEKPHARFKRDGDNLLLTQRLSLGDALCGTEFQVQTLDGRSITVSTHGEVVTPHTSKVIRGEGMPISKQPGSRGNLVIKFDVAFPRQLHLNNSQKAQMRSMLP